MRNPTTKPMTKPKSPGDLQLAILRVLWRRQEATVAAVHEDLKSARQLALTTIATMLRKMEARDLVTHRLEGRQFVYRAAVEEGAVRRDMITEVVDRAFSGSASAVVNHLLREAEFDPGDLAELKRMIAAKERELGGRLDG
jgi:BlaI family transcriptional regulator, penicillinase repressor